MYRPDEGQIFLNGEEINIGSPTAAINHGIGMIHQHFMLVPTLTVAENVALGLPSKRTFDRFGHRLKTHPRTGEYLSAQN